MARAAICIRVVVFIIIATLCLFKVELILGDDCDFTLLSGNVTYSKKTAIVHISETEEPDDLCSLEAEGNLKITCDLKPTNFDCKQIPIDDGHTGLKVILVASVDEATDKPTNVINYIGSVGCSKQMSSNNLATLTNGILINIDTVNDHAPVISGQSLDISDLPETFPFGDHRFELASIYQLKITATDGDTAGDVTSRVQFLITGGNDENIFSISTTSFNPNSNTEYFGAQLYLDRALDYKKQSHFNLTITAKDEGVPPLESSVSLSIGIKSENMLGPVFEYDFYEADIDESLIDGQKHVLKMRPGDIHAGYAVNRPGLEFYDYHNDDITYSLLIDNCGTSCDAIKAAFTLDAITAKITFDSSASYGLIDNNEAIFAIKAAWNDDYKRSGTATASIGLPKTPNPVPDMDFYETLDISINTLITSVIFTIRFNDDDAKRIHNYFATDCAGYDRSSDYFRVDKTNGDVVVVQQLILHEFCLNFTATYVSGQQIPHRSVVINVINTTLEDVITENYYQVHINEKHDITKIVPLLVDLDSYYESKNLANYKLETYIKSGPFFVDRFSGKLYAVKALDHAKNPVYELIISVSWRSPNTADEISRIEDASVQYGNLSRNEILVRVIVDDINDHAPQFVVGSRYRFGITSHVGQGQVATTLLATDADDADDFKRIYYSMADQNVPFFVNQDSGVVRASQAIDVLEANKDSSYGFVVTAANSPDGKVMPTKLLLTIYILEMEEILLMTSTKPANEFENNSSQIIDIFKEKMGVELHIIDWKMNDDGSTIVYMCMFDGGSPIGPPLKKDHMLTLVKGYAASLGEYFVADSAKTYKDVHRNETKNSTGLIIAVAILATILGILLIAGIIIGYLMYRKNGANLFQRSRKWKASASKNNGTNGDTFEGGNLPANDGNPNQPEVHREPKSEIGRESEITVHGKIMISENVDHQVTALELVPKIYPTLELYPEPKPKPSGPELDYLKSILVDREERVPRVHRTSLKFADEVMSNDDKTDKAQDYDLRF